jgi:hypothetical protein
MSGDLLVVYDCANANASRDTMVCVQNPVPVSWVGWLLTMARLFPYMVVTSALGVSFIFLVLVLASRHFLLPGIIIIGSFVLCVLWLTGLIETSLQLYGVVGNVNDNCQIYVVNNKAWGNNINTLAWLTQSTIC